MSQRSHPVHPRRQASLLLRLAPPSSTTPQRYSLFTQPRHQHHQHRRQHAHTYTHAPFAGSRLQRRQFSVVRSRPHPDASGSDWHSRSKKPPWSPNSVTHPFEHSPSPLGAGVVATSTVVGAGDAIAVTAAVAAAVGAGEAPTEGAGGGNRTKATRKGKREKFR